MRHHNLQVTGSVVVNGLGLATTADLTSYTASADAKISTLQSFTASVGTTNTFTASASSRLDSIETITASNVARLTSLEIKTGSLATTGSNTFYGTQVFSGSLYVQDNLIVQGSSSLQNITASAVSIGTNIVYLNTDTPAVRFAGLTVQDSGSSAGVTGSMLWDSLCNRWIYSNPSTIGYSGGMLLSGPRTQTLGTEPTLTCNYIAKSGGGDHLYDSCIIDDGTTTCIKNNLITTGTSCFGGTICANVNSNTFGNASSAGRALILQAGSGNQAIQFKNCWGGDGTLYACGNATSLHYVFNTYSCSDVLFIANGGNVGLSCNNPGYKLDVNGNAHFTSAGATMLIESTQQTNSSILKIVQCANGGNGNTDQGLVVQTNAADGTSNIVNLYDFNSGSPISRVRFLKNGITCFQNTVCVAGQVSSEDVRIYRSAGTTTGYINFGSTGTNYLGFDGTRFSVNGGINAGTYISTMGAATSTYGFTHCGASRWGRFGMPNSSYMYLETNADSGVYIDAQTRVAGYFCASGNIQGGHIKAYSSICGSGTRLGGGSYNTGYTSDGIYGATATPNYIVGTGYNSGFYLGYVDNGQGLYGAAYAFNVKCSHGGGGSGTAEYDAIRMRNDESGVVPFRITNWGNLYATSKNFRINHPLPSMSNTHHLVHTAIEGPQADLIYRGKVELVNGRAEVNIDESSRMTEGTFELLCQNVQSYTTNESGWVLIKSYVIGNILHIEAQDETSDDIISWLVIGERKDDGMKNSDITDNAGHLVVETLIPELES
jgi:hypothetical protein